MKAVFTDYYYKDIELEKNILRNTVPDIEIIDLTEVVPGGIKDPADLKPYVMDAEVIITQFAEFDRDLIESLKCCRVISKYAVGLDTIDVEAAHAKGIKVRNVPDYCIEEVADTAMTLLLSCMRKVAFANSLLKQGSFEMGAMYPTKRISETTLCILGFGNIARHLYSKAKMFFGRIVVYDPYFIDKDCYPDVDFMTLAEAVSVADAITVHIPLLPSTENMIDRDLIGHFQEGTVLVNTARGGLIDEDAMEEGLKDGKIGALGLDVLKEDAYMGSRFLDEPRVLLTPHIGWHSAEAEKELQIRTALHAAEALKTACV